MSADVLENIGDLVSTALVAIITADGANSPFAAFGTRSTDQLTQNRVECRSGQFYRATDQMAQNPDGNYFYNHRKGVASLMVVSQRHMLTGLGLDSKHAQAVGRCRWLMSRMAQKLTTAALGGGLQVLDIIDQGDTYSFDADTSTDRTELRFQIDVLILAGQYTTT
jgi:hypothetical protein